MPVAKVLLLTWLYFNPRARAGRDAFHWK